MSEHIQNGDVGPDTPGWSNQIMWAVNLSPQEISLRHMFVREYLIDYNGVNAALRCGFASLMAQEYAIRFLAESYVQHLIAEKTIKRKEAEDAMSEDETREMRRRQVEEALLREAHYKGPGSSQAARVAALSKLSTMYGLDKGALTGDVNDENRGGVMVVPMMVSADDWEKLAVQSQRKLVEDTNSDL